MKPVDVSNDDWVEALFIGIPRWTSSENIFSDEKVHVFLQRGERPCFIFLLENGCLVRGKWMSKNDYNIESYIESNKNRYLGIGVFHSIQG